MASLLGKGPVFTVSHRFEGVLDSGTVVFRISCAAAYRFNGYVFVGAGGPVRIDLYENPSVSSAGTALTAVSFDRKGSQSAVTVFTHTPTVSSNGTLLRAVLSDDANEGYARVAEVPPWTFKESEEYLVRATNRSGVTTDISVEVVGYETGV